MNQGQEIVPITPSGLPLEEGKVLQRQQTPFCTAVRVQKKRDVIAAGKTLVDEAKVAGESFYYHWAVNTKTGKKQIVQGGSIDMAKCFLRNWGNAAVLPDVREEENHYIFSATFLDFESGVTMTRLYRQRKNQKIGGKMDPERAEDIVFQIGQSKAIRNVILAYMPNYMYNKVLEAAQAAALNSIDPKKLAAAREKAITFLGNYGVTEKQIVELLGKVKELWMKEDIVKLRGLSTTIFEGHQKAEDIFPPLKDEYEDTEGKPDSFDLEETPESSGETTIEEDPKDKGDSPTKAAKKPPEPSPEKEKKELLGKVEKAKRRMNIDKLDELKKEHGDIVDSASMIILGTSKYDKDVSSDQLAKIITTFKEMKKK